jgi:hypothetical protein
MTTGYNVQRLDAGGRILSYNSFATLAEAKAEFQIPAPQNSPIIKKCLHRMLKGGEEDCMTSVSAK